MRYRLLALGTFLMGLFIALFTKENFRGYVGDILVVVFIYAFIQSFIKIDIIKGIIGVLVFSIFVEILQYFNIVEVLGLSHNRLMSIIIGTTFDIYDILAYTIGAIVVFIIEYRELKGKI